MDSNSKNLKEKIKFDDINVDLDLIKKPDYNSLLSLALDYSDGAITYTDNLSSDLANKLKRLENPVLDFDNAKKTFLVAANIKFLLFFLVARHSRSLIFEQS